MTRPCRVAEHVDAARRGELLVDGRVRAGLARPQAMPGRGPQRAGQQAVQEAGRSLPVGGSQQQQAARPQRVDQPAEYQLGVADPVQQQAAVDDVG